MILLPVTSPHNEPPSCDPERTFLFQFWKTFPLAYFHQHPSVLPFGPSFQKVASSKKRRVWNKSGIFSTVCNETESSSSVGLFPRKYNQTTLLKLNFQNKGGKRKSFERCWIYNFDCVSCFKRLQPESFLKWCFFVFKSQMSAIDKAIIWISNSASNQSRFFLTVFNTPWCKKLYLILEIYVNNKISRWQ